MSKKKVKPNGFYIFMKELQQEFKERQGRLIPLRNMPAVANQRWAQLSDTEKAVYQQMAKGTHPDSAHIPAHARLDCRGDPITEQRDPAVEMAEKRKGQGEAIKQHLQPGRLVAKQPFYFIHFQSLCEMTIKDCAVYLPCEVALVEFSLEAGITRTFHTFIDPGKIPLGFRFLAQDTSDKTHQIPVSDFLIAEKDYRKVLGDIEMFLDPSYSEVMPPLFTKRENVSRCKWCLQWLAANAGVKHRLDHVYEIESLFCELSGHLTGRPIRFFQAEELLKTSIYDYTDKTKCDYHEEKEVRYCSLSAVNIYAYVASESLCPEFGIALTESHLPSLTVTPSGKPQQHHVTSRPQGFAQDPYDDRVYADDSSSESEEVLPPTPTHQMRGLSHDLPQRTHGRGATSAAGATSVTIGSGRGLNRYKRGDLQQ